MFNSEFIVTVLCLVSLLLLSWAVLLNTKVKALESEVEALKHYIRTKKKLDIGADVTHPGGGA